MLSFRLFDFLCITLEKASSFYIVSNDAGYNVLINYWKDFDVSVYRVANFAKNVICQDDGIAEEDESADLATTVMDIVQDKSVASEILSFAALVAVLPAVSPISFAAEETLSAIDSERFSYSASAVASSVSAPMYDDWTSVT